MWVLELHLRLHGPTGPTAVTPEAASRRYRLGTGAQVPGHCHQNAVVTVRLLLPHGEQGDLVDRTQAHARLEQAQEGLTRGVHATAHWRLDDATALGHDGHAALVHEHQRVRHAFPLVPQLALVHRTTSGWASRS